jgi:predicted nucleic acid-binding protein
MTTRKPRYVFDTNTLISAALFERSTPGQALRHGQVLTSPDTLDELVEVLARDNFDRYLTAEEREAFLEALVERVEVIEPWRRLRPAATRTTTSFWSLPWREGLKPS